MAFTTNTNRPNPKEATDHTGPVQRCLHVFACMSNYVRRHPEYAAALLTVIQDALLHGFEYGEARTSTYVDQKCPPSKGIIVQDIEEVPESLLSSTTFQPPSVPTRTPRLTRDKAGDMVKPIGPTPVYSSPLGRVVSAPSKSTNANYTDLIPKWAIDPMAQVVGCVATPSIKVHHASIPSHHPKLNVDDHTNPPNTPTSQHNDPFIHTQPQDPPPHRNVSGAGRLREASHHYTPRHRVTIPRGTPHPAASTNPLLALNPSGEYYDLVQFLSPPTLNAIQKNRRIKEFLLLPIPADQLAVKEGTIFACHVDIHKPVDEPVEAINIGAIAIGTSPVTHIPHLAIDVFGWADSDANHLRELWEVPISVPGLERYKKLVHMFFWNERRKVKGRYNSNVRCENKEWFLVDSEEAGKVARMWSDFSALRPYDEGTGILKAEWKTKLERVNLGDGNCWESLVSRAREEQASVAVLNELPVDDAAEAE